MERPDLKLQTRIKLSDPEGYYGTPFRFWINQNLQGLFHDYCPGESARILDLGCGEGQYINFFTKASIKGSYLGVDCVPHKNWEKIKKENGLDIKYIKYDVHNVASIGKKFNFICAITTFEHFEDDKKVLTGTYKILDNGSFMLVIVPSHYSYLNYGKHGYRRYSRRELKHNCENAGFTEIKISKVCGFASFISHTIWHWSFRVVSVLSKMLLRILFVFHNRKAREIFPELHYYLDDLKFLYLLTTPGRAFHKLAIRISGKIDKALPFLEVGYLVVLRK